MNLILERTESVRYFTDMRLMFAGLGISASDYDWYVSDVETNYYVDELKKENQWLSGVELEHCVTRNGVQFIWAVFSAFPIGTRFDVTEPPFGNNDHYWTGQEVKPQLAKALFEIVAWDSSATLFIGLPGDIEERFRTAYPDTRSLTSTTQ